MSERELAIRWGRQLVDLIRAVHASHPSVDLVALGLDAPSEIVEKIAGLGRA